MRDTQLNQFEITNPWDRTTLWYCTKADTVSHQSTFPNLVSLGQDFNGSATFHEFYHVPNANSGTLGDFPTARFLRARSFT